MSNSKLIFLVLIISLIAFSVGNSIAKKQPVSTGPQINTSQAVTFSANKSNIPELKFFVMSFCPYGNQMEDVLRPVFDLLGDKVNITPHYIFEKISDLPAYCKSRSGDIGQCAAYVQNKYFPNITECQKIISKSMADCTNEKSYLKSSSGTLYSSLHGRQEGNQDVREICAWNQVGDNKKAWWDFVGLVNKNCSSTTADTCWEEQGKTAGLDTNKITECFNQQAFELIEKEVAIANQYKVSGSPTVFINDVLFPPESSYTQDGKGVLMLGKKTATQDKYRTPNVIKEALCISMKKSSKECNTLLPELTGAVPAAGGCGN